MEGLYLGLNLRDSQRTDRAFVYSSFVMSLDGRIAVGQPDDSIGGVPAAIANDRDWRLFQELAIQADVLITSGRYARRRMYGNADPIVTVYDDPRLADLVSWRRDHGLPDQPVVAVVSRSLDFDPSGLHAGDVIVITANSADSERVGAIRQAGLPVHIAGDDSVEGSEMARQLAEEGLRIAFSAAGPQVLWTLIDAGRLDRLFLTLTDRILGGESYTGLVEGAVFRTPVRMGLKSLYLDQGSDGATEQLFVSYFPT
ncbi:MAG: RibD family protein [Acidimicrobiia bacterium]